MYRFPKAAAAFITLVVVSGSASIGYAALHGQNTEPVKFVSLLVVALLSARLKLKLPGLTGNMSVNLPFILLGLIGLGLLQALVIACASTLVQSVKKPAEQIQWVQVLFNICNMALSVQLARIAVAQMQTSVRSAAVNTAVAGVALFLANTVPVAVVIALTEGGNVVHRWSGIFLWSFPYYVLGAGVTSIVNSLNQPHDWQVPLVMLPLMFGVYHCYRAYFGPKEGTITATP